MQRENKWQDRFDEKFGKFPALYQGKIKLANVDTTEIKSFIQSEINTAIAEERTNIKRELDQSIFAYPDYYEFDKEEITKIINKI